MMTQEDIRKEFKLDTPATYRIRVQGRLDDSWSDLLGGMRIIPDTIQEQQVTILTGHLPDQASLSGVLNTLYDRHVPLLSVENLDEKGGDF
jgi:hypothetical protein